MILRVSNIDSRDRIERLAEIYGWPVIIGEAPVQSGFVLEFEQGRLQLRDLAQPKIKPLFVDFLSGNMQHRRRFGLHKTQVFARAIGVTSRPGRRVIDATAGMGVDAFFLVCLGCVVTAIERSPIIYELLMDGFHRALLDDTIGEITAENLTILHADAAVYLGDLMDEARPDVVYLDPMYPEAVGKSALPKKEMQFFRKLVGPDLDGETLFAAAHRATRERVVVKRPKEAPPLAPNPTHVFAGKTARYDMYVVANQGSVTVSV